MSACVLESVWELVRINTFYSSTVHMFVSILKRSLRYLNRRKRYNDGFGATFMCAFTVRNRFEMKVYVWDGEA